MIILSLSPEFEVLVEKNSNLMIRNVLEKKFDPHRQLFAGQLHGGAALLALLPGARGRLDPAAGVGQRLAGEKSLGRGGDPVGVAWPGLAGLSPQLFPKQPGGRFGHPPALQPAPPPGDNAAQAGPAAALVGH